MSWIVAFMLCLFMFSVCAPVWPNGANDDISIRPNRPKDSLVHSQSLNWQLGDFGCIEDWLLQRLRSPDKTVIG